MKSITKKEFKDKLLEELDDQFEVDISHASNLEIYRALATVVQDGYAKLWRQTRIEEAHSGKKQVYYFSIEFLPGTRLRSTLLNLGWMDVVKSGLEDLGIDLDEIAAQEPDMALGNGGLGRLAAAFMDSLASTGYIGNGNGIRYKYGLFKQKFVNGYQVELPNDWLQTSKSWGVRRDNKSEIVRFGGKVELVNDDNWLVPKYSGTNDVAAVPYDVAMVGYHQDVVNTLRLWDAEVPAGAELQYPTIADRRKVEDLTSVLYPDDSSYEGRLLRLKQEYFFVSAGLQSILHYFKNRLKQTDPEKLPEHIAVHINDTHPAMAVAELMRLLVDEWRLDWDKAWDITQKVMSYTNHTIMAEAMEKWDINMMQEVVPRILQIITEIDRRYVISLSNKVSIEKINSTKIIKDGKVQMAHLAIIGSHSVNGVAPLHTRLLETVVLKDFYDLFPEKFNNKTNGITLRRWLQIANPRLSDLLDETVGEEWRSNSTKMLELQDQYDNSDVLTQINQIKFENKKDLSDFIKVKTGIKVDPTAIFDVQIKRLHAYKRQTLKLLHIIKLYQDLKNGIDHPKRVVIFGAKAAPSYTFAKQVIKVINEVASVINSDTSIHDKLKVVFLENYDVTLAERIIPAADLSEQISTTTKEASGTSNMKLMANGALTIATMDGANVDIAKAVGKDNIFIFGLDKDQVYSYYNNHNYHPGEIYHQDKEVAAILDGLINGTFPKAATEGRVLYNNFLQDNEEFFVVKDLKDYLKKQADVEKLWKDKKSWSQKCLVNIAHSEEFDADSTVNEYATKIWHLKKLNSGK